MEEIYAIGCPGKYESTVTKGIVSYIGTRDDGGNENIQHDAAINPGNSGGPIIRADGTVLGVTTSKYEGNGISFAIGVPEVKKFLKNAVKYKKESQRFGQLGLALSKPIDFAENGEKAENEIREIWKKMGLRDEEKNNEIYEANAAKIFKVVREAFEKRENKSKQIIRVIEDADKFAHEESDLKGRLIYDCSYYTKALSSVSNTETDGFVSKRQPQKIADENLETFSRISDYSDLSVDGRTVDKLSYKTMGFSLCNRGRPQTEHWVKKF